MSEMNSLSRKKKGNVVLDHLAKRFGETTAVDDVSITIEHAEFLTLLGPSGSGKTTILMMIAGFQIPSKGMIYIGDEPVLAKPPNKRDIGMVFQHYALFPHKTIFDNVAFPLKMRRVNKNEIRNRVYEALSLVKLADYWNRYPKQLSGGQQQRVALARALVFNPAVLLMDEPLGALDKKLRDHMQIEIKNLVEELDITVIYVTHDQQEALTMSDRIAVLNLGRLEQIGSPDGIYENPVNWFVADFIGESNLIEGTISKIQDNTCTIVLPKGLEIRARVSGSLSLHRTVKCAVRPERIFFIQEEESLSNKCESVVEDILYLGDITKYRLKIKGEDNFLVLNQQAQHRAVRYDRGANVRVGWFPEDVKILEWP